jgi:multisubunit Na+/H+ antiporter MnhE subunit
MILLGWAILGGLVWVGLRGQADLSTFVVGLVVAAVVGRLTGMPTGSALSPMRLLRGTSLIGRIAFRFSRELIVANLRQLRLVLSPRLRVRPLWIRFETVLEREATRTMLGVLISLTPGTVTTQLDGKDYLIHVLDAAPGEQPVARIRERFETLLSELEAV